MSVNWVSIGVDNGLLPTWRQAIIWTSPGILLIGPLGTNCSGILIEIRNFSFTKIYLKMSSVKWQPFGSGGDELISPRICGLILNVWFSNILQWLLSWAFPLLLPLRRWYRTYSWESTLLQVMVLCHQALCDQPLPEYMLTEIHDSP